MSMTAKTLLKVKQKREAVRTNVKKQLAVTKDLLLKGTNADLDQLNYSNTRLTAYKSDLLDLDDKVSDAIIEVTGDDNQITEDIQKASEFEEVLNSTLCELAVLLQKIEKLQNSNAQSGTTAANLTSQSVSESGARVKLPKLDLAKYNGDPLKWQPFWDSFEAAIHKNESLSDVEKFNYFRTFLEGAAKRAIEGISVTNANYNIAVETVTERFGNQKLVVFAHLNKLVNLNISTEETSKLRYTYDECEKHIRSLDVLGLKEADYGEIFVYIVLSKLPETTRLEFNRQTSKDKWTLESLHAFLKNEISACEMAVRSFGSKDSNAKSDKAQASTSKGTASALLSNSNLRQTPKCVYCGNVHFADQCHSYPDLESRKKKIWGSCFVCFQAGHTAKDCKSEKVCYYCKQKSHHSSLCAKKFGKSNSSVNTAISPACDNATSSSTNLNANATEFVPVSTLATQGSGKQVLLQTASTIVCDSGREKQQRIRILFDSGSTHSWVTKRVVEQLKLKPQRVEAITFSVFGVDKVEKMDSSVVSLSIVLKDDSTKEISVNTIRNITKPFVKVPLNQEDFPVLKNLKLAEPLNSVPESCEIDLLIGSDFYVDFMEHESIKLAEHLFLLNTKLGWIVTGTLKSNTHCGDVVVGSTMLEVEPSFAPPLGSELNLEKFWQLDAIGINECGQTSDDDIALEKFNETVRFSNGIYEIVWPWKEIAPELPENYQLSFGQLKSLQNRLLKTPDLLMKYDATIQEQLKLGIVEKVSDDVVQGKLRHYIPHHCVVKPDRATTKIRVVYNASAKSKQSNKSLNECLYRGPVMLDDLCGLLMRFCLHPIAILSDIEKAFLQISIQAEERDVTHFLWLKDPLKPPVGENLEIFRFCRVPFGVISIIHYP